MDKTRGHQPGHNYDQKAPWKLHPFIHSTPSSFLYVIFGLFYVKYFNLWPSFLKNLCSSTYECTIDHIYYKSTSYSESMLSTCIILSELMVKVRNIWFRTNNMTCKTTKKVENTKEAIWPWYTSHTYLGLLVEFGSDMWDSKFQTQPPF